MLPAPNTVVATAPKADATAEPPKEGKPLPLTDAAVALLPLGGNGSKLVPPNDDAEADTGRQAEATE